MNVTHMVPALFGRDGIVGGAERYVYELARHMARETPTTILTFGDADRTEHIDGLELRVLGGSWHVRGQRANPFHPGMFGALRPADIVHCHQQHVLATSAVALWGRATGRRVFVSDLGGGGWDVSAYISTDRWFRGHLHLSEYSRRLSGHAHDDRARVILGGVDTAKFSPGDPSAPRAPEVLYVGRLLPHKGVNDLIEALPDGLDLCLVGAVVDPRYLQDLERLAAGKRVRFLHDVDDADLVDRYRRARCVVLPSVYRSMYGDETAVPELLGQTLLEAMACGTPVVATDVASLPELVEDGVTGFLVPPNNPAALGGRLEWLRDRPAEAGVMGGAARKRVLARFTWDAVVARCLEAYRG